MATKQSRPFQLARFILGGLWLAFACTARSVEVNTSVKSQDGQPVEDAVVLASPPGGAKAASEKPADEVVDQIDKEFIPYVAPVMVGTLVRFPNKDSVRHHVYSFSPAKKFDLPLYSGTSPAPVLFDKPGVVVLGCNIHDWMVGYIYVAETPYFGKTDKAGNAVLKNLPPGEYALRVWHPRMQETEQSTTRHLSLGKTGVAHASWQITLKPEFRLRRSPVPGGRDYR